ncbi:aminodeoxychorismate lyase [Corynebacterium choanae]|uniref:4-amino-4-deoxychorismate lyase n=1 Tax=Corynebacterium choanae TaxID=1862358 RepID=A0A3G6J4J7_9CORY|nr:aminodeoxychorismate lyase [Corynebacterium choanae]AZA12822.1 4-amino-4-deoxychorismate lyase [Corynebacterium choanae]
MPFSTPKPVIVIVDPLGGSARAHNPTMPHIFFDDAAVTRGDAVFETLLVSAGKPVGLSAHLQRFSNSCVALGLPNPQQEQWITATEIAVAQFNQQATTDARCTWTLSRGRAATGQPTGWVTVTAIPAAQLTAREQGVKVLTACRGYTIDRGDDAAPWQLAAVKSVNYQAAMAAVRWAQDNGADDVIFTSSDGLLQEATTAALLVVQGKTLLTPKPDRHILPSTTIGALFDYAPSQGYTVQYKKIKKKDVLKADSVWLVSAVRMAARVRSIDGEKLAKPDNPGAIPALVAQALAAAAVVVDERAAHRLDSPVQRPAGKAFDAHADIDAAVGAAGLLGEHGNANGDGAAQSTGTAKTGGKSQDSAGREEKSKDKKHRKRK